MEEPVKAADILVDYVAIDLVPLGKKVIDKVAETRA